MPRKIFLAMGILVISSLTMHRVSADAGFGLSGSKKIDKLQEEADARSVEAFDQIILNLNEIYKTEFYLAKLTKIFGGGFEKAAGSFLLVKQGGPVYEKIEIIVDEKKPEKFTEVH